MLGSILKGEDIRDVILDGLKEWEEMNNEEEEEFEEEGELDESRKSAMVGRLIGLGVLKRDSKTGKLVKVHDISHEEVKHRLTHGEWPEDMDAHRIPVNYTGSKSSRGKRRLRRAQRKEVKR
jgi:hypothetical protein